GDVQLHHAAAQLRQLAVLRGDLQAGFDRRGAGSRRAAAAFDLDHAQAAGTEGFKAVSGTQLRNGDAKHLRGTHDAGALRHGDLVAVDLEGHELGAGAFGGAEVGFRWCEARVEDDRFADGTLDDGIHWKSPLKCLTALITGIGVSPPMAHSEADSMVSHRSLRMMC